MTARRPLFFLAWLNSTGFRDDFWQTNPDADKAEIFRLEHYLASARIARDAGFAALFLSDRPWVAEDSERPEYPIDPFILHSFLLSRVPDIGAIATVSSTLSAPYRVARQAAGVQLLSEGRFGVNIVTSVDPRVALNFGVDLPPRPVRYARATEWLEIVRGLWGSWRFDWSRGHDPGYDPSTDREPIRYRGEHLASDGALTTPRSPWGDPVVAQAGGSDDGIEFGARFSDLFYTFLGGEEDSVRWRARLRERAAQLGRDPEGLLVTPTLQPLVGSTEQEVARLVAEFAESLGDLGEAIRGTARNLGLDPDRVDPDAPLRAEDVRLDPNATVPLGVLRAQSNRAIEEGLSLRQLVTSSNTVSGTPEQVADWIERRWRIGAADGFVLNSPALPRDLESFATTVVPLLAERGVYEAAYRGQGLRASLGLPS